MNVVEGCFMPVAFSGNYAMGFECHKFYSVLAKAIETTQKQEYSITMSQLQQKISFSLTRLILLCICDSCRKNLSQEEKNVQMT